MLRWVVGSSLKFRYLVVAFAAGLIFFGVDTLRHSAVDVFPEFAPPKVEIQTPSLGLSASEVEELITVPLEHSLNGVPNLDVIRSRSVEQLSSIEMIFEPGTDLLTARQLVQERIAAITPSLPSWSSPPFMIQPLSATSRVLKIGLTSTDPEIDMMDLSMTAYWKIRARLLRVPGVANVPIWGERLDMLQVQTDPQRMAEHGVKLEQVLDTTANALDHGLMQYTEGRNIGTGGWVETGSNRLGVQLIQPIVTVEDLANLPIEPADAATQVNGQTVNGAQVNGRSVDPVRIADVADLVRDHQPLIGDAVIDDGQGLMLIVEKLPWANTVDVTEGVEQALAELEPGLPGIGIDSAIFRPATFIEQAIDNLSTAMLVGALLMIFMLGAFLYEWRTAFISVVAIPLSLIAAGLVLHARDATINTMILAGFVIALGDIVDDAIIDIENVVRRLREHRQAGSRRPTARIVLDASMEVRSAIVHATLIEIAAITPIFMLQGLSGSFFRPLATSYALALLASMVVALTVTPALSLIFFRSEKSLRHRESPLVPPIKRAYDALLRRIVRRPRPAYGAVAVVTLAGLAIVPVLGQNLLPSFKERDFLMHWLGTPSTSHPEMVRTTERVNAELLQIPGVLNAGSHIGQALLMDEVVGMYFGENWVSVDPAVDYDMTFEHIQATVDGYPGIFRDVQTYLKERIREVLTGSSEAITVRIYGTELELLREKAAEVNELLGAIPGVTENHVEFQEEIPQIQVEVDLEAAEAHGVKPGDVRRAAAYMMAGEEAGDLFHQGKAYDVQLWTTPETRQTLTDIEQLPIDTPSGEKVPLADLASIDIVPTPNVIHHENLARSIDVGANIDGTRDLGSVVTDLEEQIASVEWPLEFRAELLGEYQERQAAQGVLMAFAVAAAIIVFLLLQQAFHSSFRLALLYFLTLPVALVGGVLAAYFGAGGIISLGSLVGFFTVLGIVARNGIMLISHYQHLENEEGMPFGVDLILRGAKERIVPILMTVFTTGLALVPLILAGEIPGTEVEYPMAIVILGGLVTATLLNLFVVPPLYLRFAKGWSRRRPDASTPQEA
ncbi:MAG TPA: efflux RND transporter permease subunit [Euzebyales bacterium]